MKPQLVKRIQDTPTLKVLPSDLVLRFYSSPHFISLDRYPDRETYLPIKDEVGYMAVFNGYEIFPVVRVIVDKGKNSPVERGVDPASIDGDYSIVSIPAKLLQAMRKKANESIGLMDERGRSNEGNGSVLVWKREWGELRSNLFWLLERLNELTER